MISRRRLLTGFVLAWAPLRAAAAQEYKAGKVSRIAFLGTSSPALESDLTNAFRQGLRDLGYVEGRNLVIEYRWAGGHYERYPALVAEIVRLKVDLIVTEGTPAALAAKEGAGTIPVVVAVIGDPVALGVASSLAHPGGNITGLTSMSLEVDGKRLELLKELVPGASRVGVLWNPANPNNTARINAVQRAAKALRVTLEPVVNAADSERLDSALGALVAAHCEALLNLSDRVVVANRARIVTFAAKHRIPALYANREFIGAGGLASYAADYPAIFRRAAIYVDKILKGAKPDDLPIEQPTKFELVINLKTAKALGLTIPPSLLARADQVIE